jgi:acetyl esterase/lipase
MLPRVHVRFLPGLILLAASAFTLPCRAAEEHAVLDVWPGKAPGEQGDVGAEETQPASGDNKVTRISNVTRPTLTLYPAPKDNNTGAAILVCPGGGYNILAWDLEGQEVCQWLNSIGVNGVLLKYRVPRRKDREKHEAPLQDAQRAMSLTRAKAKEWGINPERIGVLGFSAGGHLSASLSTNFDRRAYEALDDFDKASCRPDFAVLVYPAYLDEGSGLPKEIRVSKETPPMFFAHASDDPYGPENSIALFLALKKNGVPGEMHVFEQGGHGFGLRPSDLPCSQWPKQCEAWMRARGLLAK